MVKPVMMAVPQENTEMFWDSEFYAAGKFPRSPYEIVASFVFRNAPARSRDSVRVLELGCGGGNNVWFLASEGFAVTGTDASPRAIDYAKKRLAGQCLRADLHVEPFPRVSFDDSTFDLVVERAALACVTPEVAAQTIREVRRVLVPGGRFFFNPYSTQSNPGFGYICFYNRDLVEQVLGDGWKVLRMQHAEIRDHLNQQEILVGDWRVEVEKT
jgi:SAM-dependent methyltransferase